MCANKCVYAFRDQKMLSTPLELELQDIVNCPRYVWELKCPLKKEQVLLSNEPSLQSQNNVSWFEFLKAFLTLCLPERVVLSCPPGSLVAPLNP